MFPGLGGLNPKKMQAMMKQLGIGQEEIDAERVVIECSDCKIIIEEPSVTKINMQGQESFQITGGVREVEKNEKEEESDGNDKTEETDEKKTEEDIKTIIEKTGVSEGEARKTLENANGDLTEAIISLG